MDNLTHSLFGWTLARAGLGRGVPHATSTLVVASNVPDADIVVAAVAGGVEYLAAHRGPTHGPLVIGLGLCVAGLVWAWARWRGSREDGTIVTMNGSAGNGIGVIRPCQGRIRQRFVPGPQQGIYVWEHRDHPTPRDVLVSVYH